MKKCTRCGVIQALAEFHKNRSQRDGHASACKVCLCADKAVYRAANPELIRAQQAAWRNGAPERSVKAAAKARAWREANPERFRAATEAWRKGNPEKSRKHRREAAARIYAVRRDDLLRRSAEYKRRNAAKVAAANKARRATDHSKLLSRQHSAIRRARKRASQIGKVDLVAVYERDAGRCHVCERPVPLERTHFDHVAPLARGGAHTMDNIRVACRPCNERKLHRLLTPALRDEIASEVRMLPPLVPNHRLNLIGRAA